MLTQFETTQIQALQMLLEISERTLPIGKSSGRYTLKVMMSDIEKYKISYGSSASLDFFNVCELLKKRDAGVLDFKTNDPDRIQNEFYAGYYDNNNVTTPAYEVSISSAFPENAKVLLQDLEIRKNIRHGQITIYWNPEIFELSRILNGEKKSYKIARGKEVIPRRRVLVAELFRATDSLSAEFLSKKTGFGFENLKDNVGEVNKVTETKLHTTGRELILYNDDWTKVYLNRKDFFFDF